MTTYFRCACAALFLGISPVAWSQAAVRADPADPRQAVSPIRYESAFAGYRPFADGNVVSWRAANELVHKLGGWQAFLRDKVPDVPSLDEPSQPAGKAAPAAEPAKRSGPAGHAGHR